MSHGIVHTKASVLLAGGYLAGMLYTQDLSDVQFVIGALVGVPLNPDLDVNHGKIHGNRFISKWAPAKYWWRATWFGYSKSIKHGSILSHFPVISTIARLSYLFLFILAVPYLAIAPVLKLDYWNELSWWAHYIINHPKVIVGLMSSDFIHWVLDVVTKESVK